MAPRLVVFRCSLVFRRSLVIHCSTSILCSTVPWCFVVPCSGVPFIVHRFRFFYVADYIKASIKRKAQLVKKTFKSKSNVAILFLVAIRLHNFSKPFHSISKFHRDFIRSFKSLQSGVKKNRTSILGFYGIVSKVCF